MEHLTYAFFRNKAQNEDEATLTCIDHVKAYQKDLPPYFLNDEALLERLRDIFKQQSWCQILYERSSVGMTAASFEELLKTAASNADERRGISPNSRTFSVSHLDTCHTHHHDHPYISHENVNNLVTAFFARTPPPRRHRRPFRFRRNHSYSHNRSRTRHALRRYMDTQPDDEMLEVATLFLENDCFDDNEFDDFNVWISELLDVWDETFSMPVNNISTTPPPQPNSQFDPYYIQESIPQIQEAMYDLSLHNVQAITKHLLINTGSPKKLTPKSWLKQAEWTPVKTIKLPVDIKLFRFAGQYVHASHAACLIALVTDINGKQHIFHQVAFILPDIPVPFLVGLQTQRSLALDICLRKGPGSHVRINRMDSIFPLYVQSHVWLHFKPCNQDPDIHSDWTPLIKEAFDFNPNSTNYACPVNSPHSTTQTSMSTCIVNGPEVMSGSPPTICYATPPWERDDWKSKTTLQNARRLHQALRHPTPTALLNLYRQQNEGRRLPREVIKSIENIKCRPCAEHVQLPRRPKLAVPPPAIPNISVLLDVMPHNVLNVKLNLLVMLDAGDMMLKLANLSDDSARPAFNAYLSRWIAIFDAPVFTVFDQGTNLTNDYMASNLRDVDSQLIPIPTKAPWSIGNNERSHRYLSNAIDKLLSTPNFDVGHNYERLLAEVEMVWNFTQHNNRILPHFHRFGTMPRIFGELTETQTVQARIALQEMVRVRTERLRADAVINASDRQGTRPLLKLSLFSIGQEVWFHRRKFGRRQGTVQCIDRPTIWVANKTQTYPTHENRLRPYFGDLSLPP